VVLGETKNSDSSPDANNEVSDIVEKYELWAALGAGNDDYGPVGSVWATRF
jgi:hypothetical protein